MMTMMMLLIAGGAQAQEATSCCDDDGCLDDVPIEECERSGGYWSRCDGEVCEVMTGRTVELTKTKLAYETGMWGAYFQANFDEPKGYAPINPFDPTFVDPCMNWAILYDQNPQVCEGGIPVNPQNPDGSGSHVDVCEDPMEVPCAACSGVFLACETVAIATLNPSLAKQCHDNWKDCIQKKCGLDCDY